MIFGKKEKKVRNCITISIDHENKIYLDIECLNGNKHQLLLLLQALVQGTLRSTLIQCMTTMSDPDVSDLVKELLTKQNVLNPLNIP